MKREFKVAYDSDNRTFFILEWSKTRIIKLYPDENFRFTFSCGANSDYSFSGSFYGTTIKSLTDAQNYLIEYAKYWFADDYKGITKLHDSIKII